MRQEVVPLTAAARVAMKLLGRSQISMTMHYTHVAEERAHAAAQSMAKALWD